MYPPEENLRSGYLQQNFRLFHLKDKKEQQFDFHYHDFDKIVIFLSGKVTYCGREVLPLKALGYSFSAAPRHPQTGH